MAAVSFEFFPPRSEPARLRLGWALGRLVPLDPAFVSVTCGAGGSSQAATLDTACEILSYAGVRVAGHLTCVGRCRGEVDEAVASYWGAGVRHVVALRGDMPQPGARFAPHPRGYAGCVELIDGIRRIAPFEVSVAAYPEPHPESRSQAADLDVLARKADAGASRAITQFCFDAAVIARFRDRVVRDGIDVEVVPGIMLTTNFGAVARMAARCGASVPRWLRDRFAGLDGDLQGRKLVAAIVAAGQVEALRREGFSAFHFYTLNEGDVVAAVCRLLDIHPAGAELRA